MQVSNTTNSSTRTLAQWLALADSEHPKRIDMSLERLKEVALRLDLLKPEVPVITIAGTNGKGSTVKTLSCLYRHEGISFGAFTSPHLIDFNERICINGEPVSDDSLCQAFEIIYQAKNTISLTYFEYSFLIALLLFKQHQVQRILLEVGMGGRLDSTNIIDASLAVITPIDYDHQEYLGDTLDKIAFEKAGIFRKGAKAIIAQAACHPSLLDHAAMLGVQCLIESKDFSFDSSNTLWSLGQSHTKMPRHDLMPVSASLGCAAFAMLEERLAPLEALEGQSLEGRFYRLGDFIFDVAHNPAGARWLASKLADIEGPIVALWASFKDKNLADMAPHLEPYIQTWIVVPLEDPRAASTAYLRSILSEDTKVIEASLDEGYLKALHYRDKGAKILVWGGFGVVGEILARERSK